MAKNRLREYHLSRESCQSHSEPTDVESKAPLISDSGGFDSVAEFLNKMEGLYGCIGEIHTKIVAFQDLYTFRVLGQPVNAPLKSFALSVTTMPVRFAYEMEEHDLMTHDITRLCNIAKIQIQALPVPAIISEKEQRIRTAHKSVAFTKLVELISEYSRTEAAYLQWRHEAFAHIDAGVKVANHDSRQEKLLEVDFDAAYQEQRLKELHNAENDLLDINLLLKEMAFYVQTEQNESVETVRKQSEVAMNNVSGVVLELVKHKRTKQEGRRRYVKIGLCAAIIAFVVVTVLLIYLKFSQGLF